MGIRGQDSNFGLSLTLVPTLRGQEINLKKSKNPCLKTDEINKEQSEQYWENQGGITIMEAEVWEGFREYLITVFKFTQRSQIQIHIGLWIYWCYMILFPAFMNYSPDS